MVIAVPTWGPCFYRPELFSGLPLTEVRKLMDDLWRDKLFVERQPFSEQGIFLISGFPSLHIAVVVFGSLSLGKVSFTLAARSWGFTAITAVATLYFGWHYVLDDIGGFLLGAGIFCLFVTSSSLKRLKLSKDEV